MRVLDVVQGSPEWHQMRVKYPRTASRAPVMMGASKYQTRGDLLREMACGSAEEVDAGKQFLFDRGHAAEAAARPLVEAMIVDDLYPATATDDAGYLLASYDGLTMDADTGYEHKLWNEALAAQVRSGNLDPMYYWQLEHQIKVGKLSRVIFACSDGTPEKFESMEYRPVAGRAEQLMAGWKQFDEDLANYKYVEVIPAVVAAPTMQLPALSIQVRGEISLIDNLKVFGAELTKFIAAVPANPATDQDFADCEAAVKTLEKAQNALEAAEAGALAQTASIDEMRRTVALYANQARTTRLMLEKLVKSRKEAIKLEIVQEGKSAYEKHEAALRAECGAWTMLEQPNFAGCIKNLRTVDSVRNAVQTTLANAKIKANDAAQTIRVALAALDEESKGHEHLFHDRLNFINMIPEAVRLMVRDRIAKHKEAEEARANALAEQAREKIRAEETAKLQKIEQERLEAARIQQEGIDRAARAKETATAQLVGAEKLSEGTGIPESRPGKPVPTSAPHAAQNSSAAPPHPSPAEPSSALGEVRAVAGTQSRPTYAQILKVIANHFDVTEGTADAWIIEYIRPQQRAA